jgi:hypothetical protein
MIERVRGQSGKQGTCEVSFQSYDDYDDTAPGIRNSAHPVTGVTNPELS